jgi:hypothetical protein
VTSVWGALAVANPPTLFRAPHRRRGVFEAARRATKVQRKPRLTQIVTGMHFALHSFTGFKRGDTLFSRRFYRVAPERRGFCLHCYSTNEQLRVVTVLT